MTKLSEKDLALFRGMEAEYGYVAVKDMVAIVSEEMDLSPVEMQVEVRRRLEDQRRSSRRDEDNRRQSEVDRRLEEERKRISEQSQRDQRESAKAPAASDMSLPPKEPFRTKEEYEAWFKARMRDMDKY